MITKLLVSNYRSLSSNVSVELGPLNVFVGQNGSGKSNVMDVFRFLADSMRLGLEGAIAQRHGIDAVRRWSRGRPFNLSISVNVQEQDFSGSYSFTVAGDRAKEYRVNDEEVVVIPHGGEAVSFRIARGQWLEGPSDLKPKVSPLNLALPLVSGDDRFRPLADVLRQLTVYRIYPDTLREPQKYDPVRPMNEHGSNWVSILKDQETETWKPELVAGLRKLTGDIEDLRIKAVGGFLLVQFKHTSGYEKSKPKWFDSAQESDGTLRVAGIITALLQKPSLALIGIEEPELTVHPGALPLIYDFIAEASGTSQVMLTTHNPDLLDRVDTDDVRVVARKEGSTKVGVMEESQRQAVRKGLLSLGEVHRFEGLQQELPLTEAESE